MELLGENRARAISILLGAGFTSAWILNAGDPSDLVFLVPRAEGDFASIEVSSSTMAIIHQLMGVIPHAKLHVASNREGLNTTRLY